MTVNAGFVDGANLSFICFPVYSFLEQKGSECKPYAGYYVGGRKVVSRIQEGPQIANPKLREAF